MREKLLELLLTNIIPYWSEKMVDQQNGGFYGRVSGEEKMFPLADKGAVLNARLLWFFSASYRFLSHEDVRLDFPDKTEQIEQAEIRCLQCATRAKRYLTDQFYDNTYGGVFWSVNYKGEPSATKKQFYALGFAIYGLSEFHRATGDLEALEYAKSLFFDIENNSYDPEANGYLEAKTREWEEIEDMRLSDKDENLQITMNTHLHILEPYTNLYRVWKNEELAERIRNLIDIFLNKILDKNTYHLGLFFDRNWQRHGNEVSYGHDIEASWLILEAALVLSDESLIARVSEATARIAIASLEGYQKDGSMIYELKKDGETDRDRHWWVQAETLVGLLYLDRYHNYSNALNLASKTLSFITENLVDKTNGEWFWSVREDGSVNKTDDKAGFWKCPYHNGRMCIESLELLR
jgi:mannobiose 2-epimerase